MVAPLRRGLQGWDRARGPQAPSPPKGVFLPLGSSVPHREWWTPSLGRKEEAPALPWESFASQ